MKFFLDTANLNEIREGAALGLIDGVTTNPSLVAYYPQIHYLFVEKCAWGISVLTWLIWLAASVLLLTYWVVRRELLMCVA